MRRILIIAGAPDNHTLCWKESDLLNQFLEPIANFAQLDGSLVDTATNIAPGSVLDIPLWRSIPLERTTLPTGFSQLHQVGDSYRGSEGFFAALPVTSKSALDWTPADRTSQEIMNHFYDHSLDIHDNISADISSSQLPSLSFSTDESSLATTEERSIRDSFQGNTSFSTVQRPSSTIHSAHLSDLEDVPSASYLQSIAPQTMTVNLVVGIISIAEPRTVKTRWGSTKSLVELLVGDDTKSGFSITFWLSSEHNEPSTKTIRELRRQDIVLLRNVALSVFMKKVHGHSLRKGLTKVDLLHRRKLDRTDHGGLYSRKQVMSKTSAQPQLLKTRKVQEWVMNFVGGGGGGTALGKRKQNGKPIRSWDMPPEDTQ